jgi:hypothetical protein
VNSFSGAESGCSGKRAKRQAFSCLKSQAERARIYYWKVKLQMNSYLKKCKRRLKSAAGVIRVTGLVTE